MRDSLLLNIFKAKLFHSKREIHIKPLRGNPVAFKMEKCVLDYHMALPAFIDKKQYEIKSLIC